MQAGCCGGWQRRPRRREPVSSGPEAEPEAAACRGDPRCHRVQNHPHPHPHPRRLAPARPRDDGRGADGRGLPACAPDATDGSGGGAARRGAQATAAAVPEIPGRRPRNPGATRPASSAAQQGLRPREDPEQRQTPSPRGAAEGASLGSGSGGGSSSSSVSSASSASSSGGAHGDGTRTRTTTTTTTTTTTRRRRLALEEEAAAAAAAAAGQTLMTKTRSEHAEEPHEQHVQAADDREEERARGSGSFDQHVPDQSPANLSMLDALLMTSHSTDFLPLFTNTSHPGADSDEDDDDDDDMEHSSAMTATSTPPPPLLRSRSSASFSSAALSGPLSPLGFDIDRAVGQVEALQLAPPDTTTSSTSSNNIKNNEDHHTRTESHHQYHCEAPSHAKGDAPKVKEASRRGVAAPLVNTRIFGDQTGDKMQLVWELVAPFLTVSDVGRLGLLNVRWTELVATWPLRLDTFWPPRTAREIVHDMKRIKRSLSGIRLLQGLDTEIFQVVKPSRLVFLHISGIGMERKPSAALEKLDLSAFDRLEELRLDDLFVFSSLDAIAPCAPTLRSLCLRRCTELADLSGFETMDFAQLRSLEIRDCRLVNRCDSISSLSRLQSLSLSGLSRVKDIVADIKGCTLLTHLSISRCSEMRSVEGLHAFPALTRLELTHNPSLRALPSEVPFSCPLLAQLDVSSCPGLQVLPCLAPAKHLELLIVSNTRIRDLECVRAATSLRRIDAAFCFRLVSIAALTTLKDLRCISLRFCQELRNATALAYCRHLVWVDLSETKVPRQPVCHVPTVIVEKSAGLLATRPELPLL